MTMVTKPGSKKVVGSKEKVDAAVLKISVM